MDSSQGFGHYLDRTVKRIQLAYLKAFNEKQADVTIEQWVILQQIYELGENASQRELTNLNFRTRATTARMINSLVERGYISKKRFEDDLKRYKLQLTDSGKHIIESLLPLVKELRLIGYQGINEQDFKTFLKVLDQIWKNYEKVSQNNLHSKKKKRTS